MNYKLNVWYIAKTSSNHLVAFKIFDYQSLISLKMIRLVEYIIFKSLKELIETSKSKTTVEYKEFLKLFPNLKIKFKGENYD